MSLTILDGGMGRELIRRGHSTRDGLWSAQALVDDPELVADVHRDFVRAGAEVIITNTYSTIPSYLAKAGLAGRYLEFTETGARIARAVADEFADVRVAGSLPPLSESYRFDLVPPDDEARPIYSALTGTLAPYVDLFVCETMSCIREAQNAARAAAGTGKPFWVAWTLSEQPGSGLRSGEAVDEAFRAVEPFGPEAYLFNCSTPESIGPAIQALRSCTAKPIGAYPNLSHIPDGWTLDNDMAVEYRDMDVDRFVDFARRWQAEGVAIVGGCCGIGPEYIHALNDAFNR